MNILIFGAGGDVGSRTVTEALYRGHSVSAVVRRESQIQTLPAGVTPILADIDENTDLSAHMQGQDVIISALRPREGSEGLLVPLTQQVLNNAQKSNARLIVVGGAARLKLPGKTTTVLSEPCFLPANSVEIAKACMIQSQLFKTDDTVDWAHICPPAMLVPGARTGTYRTGSDTLIVDEEGVSQISMEDFAVALIDEAETARHSRKIFTVAY